MSDNGKSGPVGQAAAAAAGPMPEAPPSYEQTIAGGGGFKEPMQGAAPPPSFNHGPPPPPHPDVPVAVPTLVVHQYVTAPNFGHRPVEMNCPHCQQHIRTSIDSEPGPMAWVLAAILCVVGFGLCACIPCCIDSLNVVNHKCPNCNNFLGRYKGGV